MRGVEHLAARFFGKVFELDIDEVLWTDESVLGDFDAEASNEDLYRRIDVVYGWDARGAGPYVVAILEALRDRGVAT